MSGMRLQSNSSCVLCVMCGVTVVCRLAAPPLGSVDDECAVEEEEEDRQVDDEHEESIYLGRMCRRLGAKKKFTEPIHFVVTNP